MMNADLFNEEFLLRERPAKRQKLAHGTECVHPLQWGVAGTGPSFCEYHPLWDYTLTLGNEQCCLPQRLDSIEAWSMLLRAALQVCQGGYLPQAYTSIAPRIKFGSTANDIVWMSQYTLPAGVMYSVSCFSPPEQPASLAAQWQIVGFEGEIPPLHSAAFIQELRNLTANNMIDLIAFGPETIDYALYPVDPVERIPIAVNAPEWLETKTGAEYAGLATGYSPRTQLDWAVRVGDQSEQAATRAQNYGAELYERALQPSSNPTAFQQQLSELVNQAQLSHASGIVNALEPYLQSLQQTLFFRTSV